MTETCWRHPNISPRPRSAARRNEYPAKPAAALAMRHALELEAGVAINLRAHDGSVAPVSKTKRGGVTIHFSQHDDQGLHGAEGNSDRSGMRGIGHGRQEEQQESQRAESARGTPGAQPNTRAYLAACVQNGGAAGK